MELQGAIYTDVLAENSIDGIDGFNFESVSAGFDGRDREFARNHLLHRVNPRWMGDDLAHPETAIFAVENDRLYFSRGKSTGLTHNGRHGNQLTEIFVATDPSMLDPLRPGQVFGALAWSLSEHGSRESEPIPVPLDINDEFETEALLDWAKSDSTVQEMLPTFLHMLHGSLSGGGSPTALIHPEVNQILRWFALGSVLLDSESSLQLGMQAYVTDPGHVRGKLIGLHPDLLPPSLEGFQVIDLQDPTPTPVPPNSVAIHVSQWLTRLDTFDAIQTIELGQRWIPRLGAEAGVHAAEMAAGASPSKLGREGWELSLAVIRGLGESGLGSDLATYADEIADSISTYGAQTPEEVTHAANAAIALHATSESSLIEALMFPTMERIASDSSLARPWAEALGRGAWTWPSLDSHEQLADLYLEILSNAPLEALPALLTAGRGLIDPRPETEAAISRAIDALTAAPNPDARIIERWANATHARELLRNRIAERLTNPHTAPSERDRLLQGTWDPLRSQTRSAAQGPHSTYPRSITPDFDAWLEASSLARMHPKERARAISQQHSGLHPETWPLALAHTRPQTDSQLWESWLKTHATQRTIAEHLATAAQQTMASPPEHANQKEAKALLSVVNVALKHAQPSNPELDRTRESLSTYVDSMPSLRERASSGFGFFRSKTDDNPEGSAGNAAPRSPHPGKRR